MDQQTPSTVSAEPPAMRSFTADELKAAVLAELTYSVGKNSVAASPRDWFLAVAFATRDIAVERWIASTNAVYADGRKRVYYLSLEFLIGRLLYRRARQSRHRRADDGGAVAARLDLDAPGADGARRGARQRRPRPPRRLLHGEHGDARRSPHTATASATTTACSGRSSATAGSRRCPRTGSLTAIRGNSSAPRSITRSASAAWSRRSPTARNRVRHVWHPAETVEAVGLRHADRRLARPARQHAAAVVGARRRSAAARRLQRRRLHRRACRTPCAPRRSPRCSIRATRPRPARSCGCGRNTSSPRPRCRTSSVATSNSLATSAPCPTRPRSSSTTPIRRSPSPS